MTSPLAEFAADKAPRPDQYTETEGDAGKAAVCLTGADYSEVDLLRGAGLDPELWSIDGPVNTRRWMRYDQQWLYYFRFNVVRGQENDAQRELDVERLVKHLERRRKVVRYPAQTGGDDAFAVVVSDWQIGKGDGDGTAGTVSRVEQSLDAAIRRVHELRHLGRKMPHGALIGTGDLFEGTCGFYANQPYLIDANHRDQHRLVRRLLLNYIDQLAPLFETFTVATVAGNHGEIRNEGKKVTDDADNHDVAVFEVLKETCERAGWPGNLLWRIPNDELSILLELGGVPVGFTHGHLFTRGSGLVQSKALEWWKGQAFGLQAVSDAKVLISSHFHHFSVIDHGGRVHIQTPANDPGSKWYCDTSGADSAPGTLTLRLDSTKPLGYGDLEIL